jgi:hypothetical protein
MGNGRSRTEFTGLPAGTGKPGLQEDQQEAGRRNQGVQQEFCHKVPEAHPFAPLEPVLEGIGNGDDQQQKQKIGGVKKRDI